ncbi:HD domain-containing protein [Kribbella steppae]|uniref:HD domain-containing protein n=1 Tax=Kribbella steppae TaxID=2512223 RepID=A0A4R2HSW6_9ACTN|nr:HD domain-containing protein [Kribbella steppae]
MAHARIDAPTICLGLLMLAGTVLRPRVGQVYRTSLDYVLVIALYLLSGVGSAILVGAVGALSQDRRHPLVKKVFNGAQSVICAAAGGMVFHFAGGPTGDAVLSHPWDAIWTTTAANATWLVVNALLLCVVLSLEPGDPTPATFLRKVALPTSPPLLGYGLLGLLLAVAWLSGLGFLSILLIFVPLYVSRWALSQYEAERRAQAATMRAFIQVIETKDLYTRGHSERVSEGVGMLGRHLELTDDRQSALEHAGLLHDVGKVGVPTSIIQKPGRLDDSEMDAIRLHPARGVELIGNIPFLEEVKSAVLHHHEKYDGSGYPAGLSGENIPYFARIIGIVDAFDCLTSTRSYRPARGVEETLQILIQDRYTHFDPNLVDAYVEVIRRHGWKTVDQPAPDGSVVVTIDHDDLSLGSGGGATGNAAGPD